ncbi:hypothetical protein EJ04DRAFT_514899 [Polyplosphaeria fusca]|uniref:Uncharacterized protein n=1 Tax=Polyplosphaeria fusca TaxID=682080 RepID=A0A9P4QNZ5_9PLEO|nr:hypothetical protein EJ04DRAFT_514899 [Polyplosphaeria fusca]
MASPLDHVVKGAPAPNTSLNHVAASAFADAPHDASSRLASSLKTPRPPHPPSDPTSLLPSSPPQIYLNLLIMEASLRSQYLTLRARRRQNSAVLTLLAAWILQFTYLLWFRPRADGRGFGGSGYWVFDMAIKVCWITGLVTLVLFWATGQYDRGVRWPRRWVGIANRGLRGMNAKMVVMRGRWWREVLGWVTFLLPFEGGLWGGEASGSSYHFINLSGEKKIELGDGRPRHKTVIDGTEYAEEDIAPGGDHIKLLLLPKPFSPDFRENWEIYRAEYWERENERRAELRKRVKARRREIARLQGGWLWWTGWRGWKHARGIAGKGADVERIGHGHAHTLSATGSLKERKRRPSAIRGRDASHSRSSSRSVTPNPEYDEALRFTERERRLSTSTVGSTATRSDSRRKKAASAQPGTAQAARAPTRLTPTGSRPSTPNESNPYHGKRMSSLSTAESLSDYDGDSTAYEVGSMGPPPLPPQRRGSSITRSERGEGNVFPNARSA